MCTTLRPIRLPQWDTFLSARQRGREFFGQIDCLKPTLSGKPGQGQWRISPGCYRALIRGFRICAAQRSRSARHIPSSPSAPTGQIDRARSSMPTVEFPAA